MEKAIPYVKSFLGSVFEAKLYAQNHIYHYPQWKMVPKLNQTSTTKYFLHLIFANTVLNMLY